MTIFLWNLRMDTRNQTKILYEGKNIRLKERNRWEFAERRNVFGIVSILAMTNDSRIILVEQYRPPVQSRVIELPAGLASWGWPVSETRKPLVGCQKRIARGNWLPRRKYCLFDGRPTFCGNCDRSGYFLQGHESYKSRRRRRSWFRRYFCS